jgi:hypothetical protein
MGLDLAIKDLGMVIAIIGYLPAITFSMLLYVVPERRAEIHVEAERA